MSKDIIIEIHGNNIVGSLSRPLPQTQ